MDGVFWSGSSSGLARKAANWNLTTMWAGDKLATSKWLAVARFVLRPLPCACDGACFGSVRTACARQRIRGARSSSEQCDDRRAGALAASRRSGRRTMPRSSGTMPGSRLSELTSRFAAGV